MLARMFHYTVKRYAAVYIDVGSIRVDTVSNARLLDLLFNKYNNIVVIDLDGGYLYKIKGNWDVVDILLDKVDRIRKYIRHK